VNKTACIICTKENIQGSKVIEDNIILSIRKIKEKMGAAKGYKLVVCKDCLEKYKKKRKNFEMKSFLYLGLGIVITLLLLFLNFSIGSLVGGLLIFLILLIAALLGYVPKIEEEKEVKKNETKKPRGRKKK
jgi:predicted RND superfamily exporter protein